MFINDLNLGYASRISVMMIHALLFTLAGGIWWHGAWLFTFGIIALLLFLNRSLYLFFIRKRGFWFLSRAVAWHWFYYFYGGVAFLLGFARHGFRNTEPLLNKVLKKNYNS